ncbi:DUF3139 domain-containing protein [Staphylococcus devriesei]|uniref:DUF3139 domain-containing protein n=1 Tax=Staphylococcus devriesei TaxID=586733 RepID=A0A2K4DTD7_9STAP|nr:DUF3139 domain-containing protein [Staphylococcus devriesei]MCE5090170.1 DUF3139 domain-containing protein [Staphylococcus devriesei]MCE5096888.1 DUF3139 domain-containing protein [Staphylococcus devriesei]PNZ90079.1 hypothetical protein CD147_01525 [Staphylococcus devriesei]PTE74214.1 DUF3139 domain-containing protein [Staphylococcus devriesei]PTF04750.1 DUF3139 domain-containing protein [Staphylococcus devriesei]
MSKKQKIIRVTIILVISLIVAIAFFFAMKTYQGHRNIKTVDTYLEQKHLKDKVKSEETLYSAKKGVYYKEVVFKDEPSMTYVIQPIGTRKGIFSEGFDSETKKNIKDAKHNDFDRNFKP